MLRQEDAQALGVVPAAAGHQSLVVVPRPAVAVIISGDEVQTEGAAVGVPAALLDMDLRPWPRAKTLATGQDRPAAARCGHQPSVPGAR